MTKIFNPEKIDLKSHPEINETVIQKIIAENPAIIGLGDLVLIDKERIQPRAGRLDILMQDPDKPKRYEIEIQLGKTDESHLIRTIEYWDIEKKRYPQYEHCAVIIAEDITSRFLNVISLFHGAIPLVAIQMNAFKFGNEVGLVFTKVLDEMPLGLIEEDEEVQEIANRDYWLKRATDTTVEMADEALEIINSFKQGFALKYNKFYIGLAKDGHPNNFVSFHPKKNFMWILLKFPKSNENDSMLEEKFDEVSYEPRNSGYWVKLNKGDVKKHEESLRKFFIMAESNFNS